MPLPLRPALVAATLLTSGSLLGAQSAAGPFGIAETTARNLMNDAARSPESLASTHAFVSSIRQAYGRLPSASRAAAVAAAFAWAKAYVSSPAFTSVYAAARQRAKPAGATQDDTTIDEELKQQLADKQAEIDKMKANAALLPEKDRPAFLAAIKDAEAMFRDPATIKALRDEIAGRRQGDQRGANDAAARWSEVFPADSKQFVSRQLRQFLTASSNVDFTTPVTLIRNPAGTIVGFVGLSRPPSSWIEAECLMAGKDMVSAGRAAAEAWIKELPE